MADKDDNFEDDFTNLESMDDKTSEDEYNFEDEDLFQFDDDDEFDFKEKDDDDDEDLFDEELMPKKRKQNPLSGLIEKLQQDGVKQNLIPIAIGGVVLLVLIFGIFKLVSVFVSDVEQPATFADTTETAPTDTPDDKATGPGRADDNDLAVEEIPIPSARSDLPAKPTVSSQDVQQNTNIADMQQDVTGIDKRLEALEQQNKLLQQNLLQLQQQSKKTAEQMQSLGQGISNMQSHVMKLNNALTDVLTAAKKAPAPTTESSSKAPPVALERNAAIPLGQPPMNDGKQQISQENAAYYLYVVIPGRAWLKSSEGKIISVAKGDFIPGYGKVVNIDAKDGIVTTDSGTKIEYGIDQY